MTGAERPPRGAGLIDTNVVILREWLEPSALPDEVAISAVTLAELSAGPVSVAGDDAAAQAERARRMLILQRVESGFDPIPFDAECARAYGQLVGAVLAIGRMPRRRLADLQIAATAVANGLPLFTTNPDDFLGLGPWLEVISVSRPGPAPA
ncbi:MAG: type II toxin-antitoxin system VapC family toxin [Propionibacteriaceae bacterium]|nr:type II toxin-antitoxin system VapC family toxin [Propionibacteriaceae bacterium]